MPPASARAVHLKDWLNPEGFFLSECLANFGGQVSLRAVTADSVPNRPPTPFQGVPMKPTFALVASLALLAPAACNPAVTIKQDKPFDINVNIVR